MSRSGKLTRTISITSGKGGVGKSTITANLAISMAKQGRRVLILDGDLGMGNVDIMFGVRSPRSVQEVLDGSVGMAEVLVEIMPGIHLIPAGSGILEVQNLDERQKRVLLDQVSLLPVDFDFMLVDTAPGIDNNVLYLNTAAHEICVVVTPEPASLADSYALIKVLNKHHREDRFSVICNEVRDEAEGLALFRRLSDIASKFLVVGLEYKGAIPLDPQLSRATRSQQLILQTNPQALSAQALQKLGRSLCGFKDLEKCKGGMQFFWEQLLGVA